MSDIVTALRSYLLTQQSILDAVDVKVRPIVVGSGEGGSESIALMLVSNVSSEHLQGSSGHSVDRVQVKCLDRERSVASALREAVRRVTQGYRGTFSGDIFVEGISVAAKHDMHEPPVHGEQTGRYAAIMDLEIGHSEFVPVYT